MSRHEFMRPPLGDFHTSPFYGRDVISADDFTNSEVLQISDLATQIEMIERNGGRSKILEGKTACVIFYEPSTRTSGSFQAAMTRLGGNVITYPDPQNFSSVSKGETLEDTMAVLDGQGDVTILRHNYIGAAAQAAKAAINPVVNAGDGSGEHPTQALLDLHTIRREQGEIDGLTVTLMGDLHFGRTVHSLAKMLARFQDVTINFVSPEGLDMPDGLRNDLRTKGLSSQNATRSLREVIGDTDVLYVTRAQSERFKDDPELAAAIEAVRPDFTVTAETMSAAKQSMTLLHPLPRVGEIEPAVDKDPRSKYFEQAEYGVEVREAVLALILGRAA